MVQEGPWGQFDEAPETDEKVIERILEGMKSYLERRAQEKEIIFNTKSQDQTVPIRRFYTVGRGSRVEFGKVLKEAADEANRLCKDRNITFDVTESADEFTLLVFRRSR